MPPWKIPEATQNRAPFTAPGLCLGTNTLPVKSLEQQLEMSRCMTPVSGLFLEGSNCNRKGLEMMLSFSGGQRNLPTVTAWAPGPGARKAPKEQKQPLWGQAAQLEASLGSVGSAEGQAFSLTQESRDQTAWAEQEDGGQKHVPVGIPQWSWEGSLCLGSHPILA